MNVQLTSTGLRLHILNVQYVHERSSLALNVQLTSTGLCLHILNVQYVHERSLLNLNVHFTHIHTHTHTHTHAHTHPLFMQEVLHARGLDEFHRMLFCVHIPTMQPAAIAL